MLFLKPSDKSISRIRMIDKNNVVTIVSTLSAFHQALNDGFVVADEPDPLYNPNEVTRVSDIIELHRKGVSTQYVGTLRSSIVDERTDEAKLNSPNLESDKLYPSFARMTAQNSQYTNSLNNTRAEFVKQVNDALSLEKLSSESDKSNDLVV